MKKLFFLFIIFLGFKSFSQTAVKTSTVKPCYVFKEVKTNGISLNADGSIRIQATVISGIANDSYGFTRQDIFSIDVKKISSDLIEKIVLDSARAFVKRSYPDKK